MFFDAKGEGHGKWQENSVVYLISQLLDGQEILLELRHDWADESGLIVRDMLVSTLNPNACPKPLGF